MLLGIEDLHLMCHVPDFVKEMAKVATGVGLVVAESISRLRFRDLGSAAFQTLRGVTAKASRLTGLNIQDHINDFITSEAEFQALREVRGRRRHRSPSRRSICHNEVVPPTARNRGQQKNDQERSVRVHRDEPQPQELFAPKKAEASRESRPFTSQAGSLSQKVDLPSVDLHLPQKKSRDSCSPDA